MRYPLRPLVLLAAIAAPSAAPAQPAPFVPADPPSGSVLTVDEAVSLAVGIRPEVARARAEHRRAEAGVAEERAARLPMLDGSGQVVHHDEPVPVTPFHGFGAGALPEFDTTLLQGTVHVEYLLWNGGRRAARIDRAEEEAGAAAEALDEALQEIAAETVETYLRVLTLGTTVTAADARIEALLEERGRITLMFDVGRAPEVDVRRVEASLASARAERARLAASLETAERDLARLMGTPPKAARFDRLAPVSAAADDLLDRDALRRGLEDSPRIAAAHRRLLAAAAAVEIADGADMPTLSAFSDFQELGSTEGDFEEEWTAGLRVTVPIFRGGEIEAREAGARANRDAVAESLRLVRLELESALDAGVAAVREARARREALAEAEEQYLEVVRVERLRLETGVGVEADYLEAEAALLDTRAALAEARHAEVAARVRIARLTGELELAWIERELVSIEREPASIEREPETGGER